MFFKFKNNFFEVNILHILSITFLLTYILFFLRPVFFQPVAMVFPHYVPEMSPKGADLRQMLSYSESWFLKNSTPYIGNNLYPPLASILFSIFIPISFDSSFRLITLATVASFVFMTVFLPLLVYEKRKMEMLPIVILISVTGLSSYGLQFEIERGQFNVIAMFFCFVSLWIWHGYRELRIFAYILFSISVQLKVFPLIFVIMFVDNWTCLAVVLRRMTFLMAFNFALFFILGIDIFFEFIAAIKLQAMNPYMWWGNHSVKSFVQFLSEHSSVVSSSEEAIKVILYFLISFCLIFSIEIRKVFKNGIDAILLFSATIAAMLIPSVSHDYKLSILPPAFALFIAIAACRFDENKNEKFGFLVSLIPISFFYFSSMYSFVYRSGFLQNSAVYLILMLVCCASLRLFIWIKK